MKPQKSLPRKSGVSRLRASDLLAAPRVGRSRRKRTDRAALGSHIQETDGLEAGISN